MRSIYVTLYSFLDIAVKEIEYIADVRITKFDLRSDNYGFLMLEGDADKLLTILAHSHLCYDFLLMADICPKDNIEESLKNLEIEGDFSFCLRAGQLNEAEYAPYFGRRFESAKVDLKNPDYEFGLYIAGDKLIYGVREFKEPDRRDYRIFLTKQSVKAPVCYAMTAIHSSADKIVNFFTRDGVIAIEKAMQGKQIHDISDLEEKYNAKMISVGICDPVKISCTSGEFSEIRNAKSNAKIAGVMKKISFSRNDVPNLDLKFEDVDLLTGMPPLMSKRTSAITIGKIYEYIFSIAKVILAKKGKMSFYLNQQTVDLICQQLEKNKLRIEKQLHVHEDFFIVLIGNI